MEREINVQYYTNNHKLAEEAEKTYGNLEWRNGYTYSTIVSFIVSVYSAFLEDTKNRLSTNSKDAVKTLAWLAIREDRLQKTDVWVTTLNNYVQNVFIREPLNGNKRYRIINQINSEDRKIFASVILYPMYYIERLGENVSGNNNAIGYIILGSLLIAAL